MNEAVQTREALGVSAAAQIAALMSVRSECAMTGQPMPTVDELGTHAAILVAERRGVDYDSRMAALAVAGTRVAFKSEITL
jgi:hypothetical protein